MNEDRNYEYIKGRFDEDGVHTPDSLSEDKILAMLEALPDEDEAERTTHFTKVAAKPARCKLSRTLKMVAACLVITLVSIPVAYKIITAPPNTAANEGDFHTFSSYDEIARLIKSIHRSNAYNDRIMGVEVKNDDVELASSEGGPVDSVKSATAPSDSDGHSNTYLQVYDVDEADIIKTDGKYIYYVNQAEEVVILSAKDGKTEEVSKLGYGEHENYINDIFLKGDTLVTVGWIYDSNVSSGTSGISVYDISDRNNPVLISEFKQTGNIVSSRLVGNYVYLVTNDWAERERHYFPQVTIDGNYKDLPLEDICCVPEPDSTTYTIVSAIDITSGKSMKSKTKAVLGSADTIYCNDHALYTAVTRWNRGDSETTVLRCSFNGLKVKFDRSATLDGIINNQFSMDENNGYFRIATTANRNGMSVNNLFILDKDFQISGKINGFARDESIKAVRFIGDKAYVITYKQIDPLFVIDVSNPEKPKIEGEVEIEGFSSLLVPVGNNRLLGIGYATGDNGYGGEYSSGLKLALFDISNPSKPRVIDSREFADMQSPAQDTHLALTVNKNDGWYAIPYYISVYGTSDIDVTDLDGDAEESSDSEASDYEPDFYEEGGVLRFSVDDNISVIEQHKLSDEYISRCVYIGEYIYALNQDGYVYSYRAK